nr:Decarboxylase, pyridoxal-dependent [uncultured bacterium]
MQSMECKSWTAPEVIRERLASLFSVSEQTLAEEREMDRRLSAIVEQFLRDNTASTDIDMGALTDLCKESRLRDEPSDVSQYVDFLSDTVVKHSTHTASPRFIGHMTMALPYFVRPLSKLLAALNQNPVKVETAKSLTPHERQTTAMFHRLVFGLSDDFYAEHIQRPESTLGMVVTGGTSANVTALWCARNSVFKPTADFNGIEEEGLIPALQYYGYKGGAIIGSSVVHYSVQKAADLLGIGSRGLVKVPVDSRNRIDLVALREAIDRCRDEGRYIFAIVGLAGSTDSGSIDPLLKMAEIAREQRIHFHVDAAWGGPLLFSKQHRSKLAGIEYADSVTIDGHKQLYLPMGVALMLLRDPHQAKAIEKQAQYIVRPGSIDLGKRYLEGSRPAMSLFLHAALSIIGPMGYEVLLDESIERTRYLVDRIRAHPEFELLIEPEINIVNYRFIPRAWRGRRDGLTSADNRPISEFNVRLQKAQRNAGRSFVSRTVINSARYGEQVVALRAILANPLTTEADINAVLQDQLQIAEAIA